MSEFSEDAQTEIINEDKIRRASLVFQEVAKWVRDNGYNNTPKSFDVRAGRIVGSFASTAQSFTDGRFLEVKADAAEDILYLYERIKELGEVAS